MQDYDKQTIQTKTTTKNNPTIHVNETIVTSNNKPMPHVIEPTKHEFVVMKDPQNIQENSFEIPFEEVT